MDKRKCRKCKEVFPSRNSMFRYLANIHQPAAITDTTTDTGSDKSSEASTTNNCIRKTAGDTSYKAYTAPTTPQFADSAINPAIHIGTGFGFRGWHYTTAYAYFNTNSANLSEICLDSGSQLTIAEKEKAGLLHCLISST
jgi:hypothetical protein